MQYPTQICRICTVSQRYGMYLGPPINLTFMICEPRLHSPHGVSEQYRRSRGGRANEDVSRWSNGSPIYTSLVPLLRRVRNSGLPGVQLGKRSMDRWIGSRPRETS